MYYPEPAKKPAARGRTFSEPVSMKKPVFYIVHISLFGEIVLKNFVWILFVIVVLKQPLKTFPELFNQKKF